MVSVQFFVLGMLGEMGSRIYFSNDVRPPFAIRRTVNFDAETANTFPQTYQKAA